MSLQIQFAMTRVLQYGVLSILFRPMLLRVCEWEIVRSSG